MLACCFWISSCKDSPNTTKSSSKSKNFTDVLASHIDSNIVPGNDFFQYTNGGWIKRNPIPTSENEWGIFNLVDEENSAQLKKISEEASAANYKHGEAGQQIGDFFYSGMDSINIEKIGITAIQNELNQINQIKTTNDLLLCIASMQQIGMKVPYEISIGQDMKNSEKNMMYLSQSGLGLPNRDFYFNTDSIAIRNRNEYLKHVTKMLSFLEGDSNKAKAKSMAIMKLETDIATSHKKLDELRDPYANYHKMTFKELSNTYPTLNWNAVFANFKIKTDTLIVGQPQFFQKLNSLISSTPIDTWKTYLTWQLLHTLSPHLNTALNTENFHFYETILNGTKEPRVRWKRVLDTQEEALGDAMGQLFVKEYFPEKTKKRYTDLVEQIVISYREHIQKLDWMSDSTKQKAIKKLNAITRKVGYPNTWKDYSSMEISRESYCKNVLAANRWHFNYQINKLGKPVDRNEWNMTPQTYNAYYNPSNNEIVLPAAIFTAPGYRDEDIDDAVIYGYVGASTIGHELTHGFDDEGRQFDEMGNLKNWWSQEDEQKFKAKAAMLVEQFNQYTVLNNLHPNGKATLGENIADLGGIVIALDAFKKTQQFKEGKLIAGLTPIQRYFMGYAYGWMQTRTPEKLAARLLTDVHAPIFLRVNGPMSNCDEWYKAFNVSASNSMYRDSLQRVRIW